MDQFVLDLSRPEPPTFENFVAGDNREVVAALMALASGHSHEYGVLVWGAAGAGKSHLLAAAASLARTRHPVVECLSPRDVPAASNVPPSALLSIDDIETADAEAQGRLFTLLNALAAHGGRWIASATAPPARLPLREDLRTRFALGLVLEVVPLADADKAQALAQYAKARGFRLSEDVIAYLLAHGRRDMASLVATLGALDRHSLATQRAITIPLLRDWLQRDLGLPR